MNKEEIFNHIISELQNHKCILIKGKDTFFPKWKSEREKYICNGTHTNQNVREILPNEIIIEFDEIGNSNPLVTIQEETRLWIDKIKDWLIKNDYSFYITNHNGKSSHIRFQIQGLENYDFHFIKKYKFKLVQTILKEIEFKSGKVKLDESLINTKNKLLSLELQPHFKTKYNDAVEEIIFSNWKEVKKNESN